MEENNVKQEPIIVDLSKNIEYFKELDMLLRNRNSAKSFIATHEKFFNCKPNDNQIYSYSVNLSNAEISDEEEYEDYCDDDYWG